jgi:hypothetical protein
MDGQANQTKIDIARAQLNALLEEEAKEKCRWQFWK